MGGWHYRGPSARCSPNATAYPYDYAFAMTTTTLPTPVVLDDGNQYVYGAGLASMKQSGNWVGIRLPADGLGSTMAIVDSSGNSQKSYQYDVYGEVTGGSGSLANEFDFAGQQTDGTGLQYLRARYYDPETGTFLSRDPLSSHPNWLRHAASYAAQSPVALADALGLKETDKSEATASCSGWCWTEGIPGLPGSSWEPGVTPVFFQQLNGDDKYRICIGLSTDDCSPAETAAAWGIIYKSFEEYVTKAAKGLIGEYIKIGGKKIRIGEHGATRMAQRGFTKAELENAMKTAGKRFKYKDPTSGRCTDGYYSAAENVFVAVHGGEVVTVFEPSAGKSYVDGLKQGKC